MHQLTLAQQAHALAKKEFSARELTQYYLKRIEQHDRRLNSFISVTADQALQQAEQADQMRAAGNNSPLLGIPLAHQDSFCSEGIRTSCGSKMLDNFIAPYSAHLLERLQHSGCVQLGTLNMGEFGMDSHGTNSFYGACINPWDAERVSGGAACGSAVAVAAGLAAASSACDTNGDLRLPAAYNGLTGLKPTYGRISRLGITACASSFDQAGFITRTAQDSALLLQASAGFDERDSTSAQEPVPDYSTALNQPLQGLRVGIIRTQFDAQINSAVGDSVLACATQLEQLGAVLTDIELPHLKQSVATAAIISSAEASTNMSRFDGVRFGYRCDDPSDLNDLYQRSRSEALSDQVQRRIMLGAHYLSVGQYRDYYEQAQKVRRLIKNDFLTAFSQLDLIIMPTMADLPHPVQRIQDVNTDFLVQRFTMPASLAGLPALTFPISLVDKLPVGAQLIAPWFQEARLLNAAHQYQQATDWHHRTASGF